jgi:transposase InsO family protein
LKKEQPRRSDVVINRILKQEFGRGLPRSTLYRHLRREGATRRKLGVSQQKVRCRWTRDQAGALWVGDFEHGPPVLHEGRAVATRLSAWIDCHSRYVVEARYYVRENFDVLVDSLLRGWTHHGVSRELYVDNAKIYHARALKLACTQLNIKLLHRPPRDPAPGGLIERFFQTLQGQLEAEIRAARLLSLGDINRALTAWLTQEYHAAVHSETGQSPHERYREATRFQRSVRLQSVMQLFLRREWSRLKASTSPLIPSSAATAWKCGSIRFRPTTSHRKFSSTVPAASIWASAVFTGERRDITHSPNRPPAGSRLSRRISTPWRRDARSAMTSGDNRASTFNRPAVATSGRSPASPR